MTMIVKRELCTGCGACLNACPNGAILMREGKAFINQAECVSCQACAAVCRTGAVQVASMVSQVIVEKPVAIKVLPTETAMKFSQKQPNWGTAILSLLAQRLLPCLVDALVASLERRFSTPVQERATMTINPVGNHPYPRRRQRRGRYSKI